ncbi:MAG: DUF4335 domain-containing protein [Halothece sp.]
MTIRRQYSLPNCSLILDGWAQDMSGNEGSNGRPLMSMVMNAECRFTTKTEQNLLKGDREFLESLVRVVNHYAQYILSGINAKNQQDWVSEKVKLEPIPETNRHRLQYTHQEEGKPETTETVDLNTVELFDLIEAIDQLLNDGTTLPELTLSINPNSRRLRSQEEPLRKRATPALTGVASLTVAAIALFLVPVPEMREAEVTESRERREEETLPDGESENGEIVPSGIEETLEVVSAMENTEEIEALAEELQTTIEENWEDQGLVQEPLSYRVWVTSEGDVIAYQGISDPDRNITEVPALPNLLSALSEETTPEEIEAIAELEVIFDPSGTVEVMTE